MKLFAMYTRNFTKGVRNYSKIGFIGLGNMGNHMARHLLKKGYQLTVYDINETAVANLVKAGAKGAQNAAESAQEAEVIISMLPTGQHVLDCYTGDEGVLSSIQKNALLIDSSTIDPSTSQNLAKEAGKFGARFIDAPVSGGVVGAENGTLTFMIGGSKADYDDAKPVLEAMGSGIVHCGDIGMGQSAKICNNMLLAISMIGVSECFNLGEKLGLDSKVLAGIINTSTGRCWSSELYNPVPGLLPNVPSSNDYKGGFGTTLLAKDLGLASAAAIRTGSPIPLGALSHQIYRTAIAQGYDDKDFSVIYKFFKGPKYP